MQTIRDLSVRARDVSLREPFAIALGEVTTIENVLVVVETSDGVVGYGEGSPFPPVNGETRGTATSVIDAATPLVEGEPVSEYRRIVEALRETFAGNVSALFAVETAILDAYCRSREIPLSELFGGLPRTVVTDVTLPVTGPESAASLTRTATDLGYGTFKVKAEGDPAADLQRVRAVTEAAPDVDLILDANQAYDPKTAVEVSEAVVEEELPVEVLEQPVSKDDIDGLAFVREQSPLRVAADESVSDPSDAMELVERDAVDVINLKLGKSGILGAADIVGIAAAGNVDLMMSCMIEGRVGIHTSAHFVAGTGAFEYVDLDGQPRLPKELHVTERGPEIAPGGPGHGVVPGDE